MTDLVHPPPWFDNVLATPILGVHVQPNFKGMVSAKQRLAPIFTEVFAAHGEVDFAEQPPFGIFLKTKSGHQYQIQLDSLVMDFTYKPGLSREPGALPVEPAKKPRPYRELLRDLSERFEAFLQAVAVGQGYKAIRVGVVLNSLLDPKALPPGVQEFKDYMTRQFDEEPELVDAKFLARFKTKGDGFTDRCLHVLQYNKEQKPYEIRLNLDWQRVITEPKVIDESFTRHVTKMTESALEYFQQVGERGVQNAP